MCGGGVDIGGLGVCLVCLLTAALCRWKGVKPHGGPSGNPSLVLVQLEDVSTQLRNLQDEAEQLFKVRSRACVASGCPRVLPCCLLHHYASGDVVISIWL